jgi:hypothetical protein
MFSATDYNIKRAYNNGLLYIRPFFSERFQEYSFMIEDDCHIIECHLTREDAVNRIKEVCGADAEV